MKEVFIIGGGPSLENFNYSLLKDKTTIVINKAIWHVPNPTYFITHDLAFFKKINIADFEEVKTAKFFVLCSITFPYTEINSGRIYDRRFGELHYDLNMLDSIIISKKEKGVGLTFDDFRHGHHSGFSALQLAVIMGFNPIYLLGYDLICTEKTHCHEGYGETPGAVQARLDYYYGNYEIGLYELAKKAPEIKVYSCSKISRLNKIIEYKRFYQGSEELS